MTLEIFKEQLPDITIVVNDKKYLGKVRGRKLKFPQVFIPELNISEEYSWDALLRMYNREHDDTDTRRPG